MLMNMLSFYFIYIIHVIRISCFSDHFRLETLTSSTAFSFCLEVDTVAPSSISGFSATVQSQDGMALCKNSIAVHDQNQDNLIPAESSTLKVSL